MLNWTTPDVGSRVATYAFPNCRVTLTESGQMVTVRPDIYPGAVEEVESYRDRLLVYYPYLRVSCRVHGAASGGPLFDWKGGGVVGINTCYLEPVGPGYAARLHALRNAFIENANLDDGKGERRVWFHEFVAHGVVRVQNFVAQPVDADAGEIVYLNKVKVSATMPAIDYQSYA